MSVKISSLKRCSVRFYLQLFVGGLISYLRYLCLFATGTCFIQKIYAPSSSLLQGKHLPFSASLLRLNIFRIFVILSLTQLYRYTPKIFLLTTTTFKYTYWAPQTNRTRISANIACFIFFLFLFFFTCDILY